MRLRRWSFAGSNRYVGKISHKWICCHISIIIRNGRTHTTKYLTLNYDHIRFVCHVCGVTIAENRVGGGELDILCVYVCVCLFSSEKWKCNYYRRNGCEQSAARRAGVVRYWIVCVASCLFERSFSGSWANHAARIAQARLNRTSCDAYIYEYDYHTQLRTIYKLSNKWSGPIWNECQMLCVYMLSVLCAAHRIGGLVRSVGAKVHVIVSKYRTMWMCRMYSVYFNFSCAGGEFAWVWVGFCMCAWIRACEWSC